MRGFLSTDANPSSGADFVHATFSHRGIREEERDRWFLENSPTRASPKKVSNITKTYSLKPHSKHSRNSAQRRRSPLNRPASLLPLHDRRMSAGHLNPSGDVNMSKRIALLSAAAFSALALDRHPGRAGKRAGQNEERDVRREDRDGRRRRDVPLEEHHSERRQLQGPHHAGGRGEGRRSGRYPGRQGPVHGVRADQRRFRQAAGRHRRYPGEARRTRRP